MSATASQAVNPLFLTINYLLYGVSISICFCIVLIHKSSVWSCNRPTFPSLYGSSSNDVSSPIVQFTCCCVASSGLPIISEYILDFFGATQNPRTTYLQNCRLLPALVTMICGVLMSNLVNENDFLFDSHEQRYLLCYVLIRMSLATATFVSITSLNSRVCDPYVSTLLHLLSQLPLLLMFLSNMLSGETMSILYSVINVARMVVVVPSIVWWAILVSGNVKKVWSSDDLYCMCVFSMPVLSLLYQCAMDLFPSMSPEIKLAGNNVIFVLINTILCIFPERVSKYEELKAKDLVISMKKSFIRHLSHEIRTPLNIVFIGLQLCLNDMRTFFDQQDTAKIVVTTLKETGDACGAALTVLNDILLYDKLESGASLNFSCAEHDVVPLIETSVNMFAVQAREKQISIVKSSELRPTTLTTDLVVSKLFENDQIFVDKSKFEQILRNLLSNAIKFTSAHGEVKVLAKRALKTNNAKEGESWLLLQVTDNGAGISKADQVKLFKEIVQFRPQELQNGGGSGLGMFITKSIVDLHHGEIEVFSEGEGRGTTFTVLLPLKPLEDKTEKNDNGDIMVSRGRSFSTPNNSKNQLLEIATLLEPNLERKQLNVLIVDDSEMTRKMMIRMLNQLSVACDEAEDGLEAIRKIQESVTDEPRAKEYDAVLMDFMMPNMDGPTATKALRSLNYVGPIIGLTGNIMQADIDLFKQAGVTDVISKPIDFGKLKELLHIP